MLDAFFVVHDGGFVLFAHASVELTGDPLGALVRHALLEERGVSGAAASYDYDAGGGAAYTLQWTRRSEERLLFVAVYQRALVLGYVAGLLGRAAAAFVGAQPGVGAAPPRDHAQRFGPHFRALLRDAEGGGGGGGAAATAVAAAAAAAQSALGDAGPAAAARRSRAAAAAAPAVAPAAPPPPPPPAAAAAPALGGGAFDVSRVQRNKKAASSQAAKPGAPAAAPAAAAGKPPAKAKRVWGPSAGAATAGDADDDAARLDFSEPPPPPPAAAAAAAAADAAPLGRSAMDDDDEDNEDYGEEDEEDDDEGEGAAPAARAASASAATAAPARPRLGGWLAAALRSGGGGGGGGSSSSVLTSLLGKSALEPSDVAPALEALHARLLRRNVAAGVAERLVGSVGAALVGTRLAPGRGLRPAVVAAFGAALARLLTPARGVDVLRDVAAARAARPGAPYTVVFCGVNGVGKSTSLAKVAHWLKANGVSVLFAACDTFRSGAVEQLRTHAARLGVGLFERGYESDPAAVAAAAVREAARQGCDVVLIDTAGRMQDNEPLMRSLAKLVATVRPDLVLFVGEALAGNDAVDQLAKFSARLADLSSPPAFGGGGGGGGGGGRGIDGVVLTKFDAVDDRVGAALSLAATSPAPVVFVGTGQGYGDLKRFQPRSVVRSLLA